MLLKRITLDDFGLFRGRNELTLTPRAKGGHPRPVVLIGGKNGSGKTTILDALRLCLYGPLALGSRVSHREYEAYLGDRIHRAQNTLFQTASAGVAIEFDYAQAGRVSTYCVVAQKLARHSDPRLTANVYTSLGLADLHRAVESLPAASAAPPAGPRRAEPETPG